MPRYLGTEMPTAAGFFAWALIFSAFSTKRTYAFVPVVLGLDRPLRCFQLLGLN